MINVLVLCTGNSCRSQMAEGFLRKYLGDNANVYSAGIEAHGLNEKAVTVMKEIGLDISGHLSNTVDQLPENDFDFVLTVCDNARENCPYFPASTAQFHHNFPDPAKAEGSDSEVMNAFRECRDLINDYSRDLTETILKNA